MSDPDGPRAGGRQTPDARRGGDPFADWFEAWRQQYADLRRLEEAERSRARREIRWLSALIVAWSLVTGAAAALAIWIVL